MFNNIDREQKEIEAIQLIDRAEILIDEGYGDKALILYEKAAQIYIDFGSYIKLDELFIRIVDVISHFKTHIQAVYRLSSIIRKTEELKLYEISAKLLIQLANIYYKMHDWESAGENWQKASEYLFEIDPEEYLNLASILLLKAGQMFERSNSKKTLGKTLILKAVMKINKFDDLYQQEEKRAHHFLDNKEFESSANKFLEIATHFKKALDNLGDLIDEEESKETMLNAKARFTHFVAEYQTIAIICLTSANDPSHEDRIKQLGLDSIKLFKESISLLKEFLFPMKIYFDKEVIYRVTFDTMLLTMIQRIINDEKLNCNEYLLENLQENKELIKKLKKTPYFKISKKIQKVGITDCLNDLLKINLGHFEAIKNMLISHFLNT